jgi:hypothetical protein
LSYWQLKPSNNHPNSSSPNTSAPTEAVKPKTSPESAITPPQFQDESLTSISFEQERFNFGTIKEGEKVSYAFKFKNTGNRPLVISNAKGSCGCTVPQWPKEPIPPGGSGEIKVEFNSEKKLGKNDKYVMVEGNFPKKQLTISGEVIGFSTNK